MLSNIVSANNIWTYTVHGNKVKVQEELNKGVSIEAKDRGGTPLWYAASYAGTRKEDMVKFIVSKGGDLDATYDGAQVDGGLGINSSEGGSGLTILHHFTTKQNNYNIFKLLLDLGADPLVVDSLGNTPLFYCNETRYAHALLSKGATLDHPNNRNTTPLLYHIQKRRFKV